MDTIRTTLRLVSFATAAIALWLLSVVLFVLPSRDPGHVLVWAVVAVVSALLVALSIAATRGGDHRTRPSLAVLGGLSLTSLAALAFGLLVVVSSLTTVPAGDSEDYLVVVGLILAVHGALGLTWAGASFVAAGPRLVRTRAGR